MSIVRVNALPNSVQEKLLSYVRPRFDNNNPASIDLGDIYLLDDWKDYNNDVFLNSYLFGEPKTGELGEDERTIRPVIQPGEKDSTDSAISLVFGEQQTEDWMISGPGQLVKPSSVPIIRYFFTQVSEFKSPISDPAIHIPAPS